MILPEQVAITPELIQQMLISVSPWGPGGRRITPQEFQQITAALTGIVAGTLAAGMVGMLTGAVVGRFSRETAFGIREIAGLPIPVLKEVSAGTAAVFTDTGTQIESLTDRELWLELMEAFEEARSRAHKRTSRR